MNILLFIVILILGLICGSIFNRIGNILSNDKSYNYNVCDNCNYKVGFIHISFFSYIFNLGRCKYCKKRISLFPSVIEVTTVALFLITYLKFYNEDPIILNLIYSLLFISSLLIIIVSDIKYMIIPDKVLIFFGIVLAFLKLLIGFYNEEYKNFLDLGYAIIFLFYDGFFMFAVMYLIKKLGDFIIKKDSMGGGDIKLMFYISMILGWKLSIVVIFLAAFLALPYSIINMIKSNKVMFAFGPFLSLGTLILFLTKVDFNTIIGYLL